MKIVPSECPRADLVKLRCYTWIAHLYWLELGEEIRESAVAEGLPAGRRKRVLMFGIQGNPLVVFP
jgi:hypothetical protein